MNNITSLLVLIVIMSSLSCTSKHDNEKSKASGSKVSQMDPPIEDEILTFDDNFDPKFKQREPASDVKTQKKKTIVTKTKTKKKTAKPQKK